MTPADAKKLAEAIAHANGHPQAADWAAKVADIFKNGVPAPEPVQDPIPE